MLNKSTFKILNERFDNWIFHSYKVSPSFLGLCRIVYASFILFLQMEKTDWIVSYPKVFFSPPPGPAMLFSDFPPIWYPSIINIMGPVVLILLLIGYQTKFISILFSFFGIFHSSFICSFEQIVHPTTLFLLIPFFMAFANWGAGLSIDALQRNKTQNVVGWPLTLVSILIGFAMFTSGLVKLEFFDPTTKGIQGNLYWSYFARGTQEMLSSFFMSIKSTLFWEFLDWTTVIFELSFLVVPLFPRIFRVYAGLAVLFHTLILYLIGLDFSFLMMVYIFYIPFEDLGEPIVKIAKIFRSRIEDLLINLRWFQVLIFIMVYTALYCTYGNLFKAIME